MDTCSADQVNDGLPACNQRATSSGCPRCGTHLLLVDADGLSCIACGWRPIGAYPVNSHAPVRIPVHVSGAMHAAAAELDYEGVR